MCFISGGIAERCPPYENQLADEAVYSSRNGTNPQVGLMPHSFWVSSVVSCCQKGGGGNACVDNHGTPSVRTNFFHQRENAQRTMPSSVSGREHIRVSSSICAVRAFRCVCITVHEFVTVSRLELQSVIFVTESDIMYALREILKTPSTSQPIRITGVELRHLDGDRTSPQARKRGQS